MPALDNTLNDSSYDRTVPQIGPVLSAAQDGGTDAWTVERRTECTEKLIDAFHGDVFRYCFWLCHSRELAEDASQETFLRAYKGIHGLREEAAAKGWLLRIARNEVLRAQMKPRVPTAELDADFSEVPPDESLENVEWVREGLRKLTEEFRLVVLMYYFEHLSYAEIAEQLEIPMGTVMSRLNRAKQQLRQSLKQ